MIGERWRCVGTIPGRLRTATARRCAGASRVRSRARGASAVLVLALGLIASSPALAQSVHWNPPIELALGQIAKVELVFEQCAPEGDVEFPPTPAFEVLGPPTESRVFSMVNFERRSSVTLGYPVRPLEKGVVELPSFEVETSEGRFLVPAARFRVSTPSIAGGPDGRRQPLSEVAGATLVLSDPEPFAGEVVDLRFDVSVDARRQASLAGQIDWDSQPMIVEPWSDPAQLRVEPGRNGVRMRTRGLFPEPGTFEVARASQDINVETEQSGGGLFRRRGVRTVTVVDELGPVRVKPLPEPAPPGFEGAVGSFELTSSLAPTEARVGEPITWTLHLRGTGNWTAGLGLPPRAVPNDIEVIRPKTLRSFEDGSLFEGEISEDLVLIPTRPGTLRLEPVRVVYFDPALGRYTQSEIVPPPIEILPALGSPLSAAPSAPVPSPAPDGRFEQAAPAPRPPEIGVLPGGREEPQLPREPVAGSPATGRLLARPLAPAAWLMVWALALVPGLVWILLLGRRHAVAFDPLSKRRAARGRVAELLERASKAKGRVAPSLLLEWQRASAELLGVPVEAPTALRMEAADWGRKGTEISGVDADAWRRLWRDSESAIHGVAHALPPDWVSRARSVLEPIRLRAVPLEAGLRPAHLWPAVLVAVLVLLPTTPLAMEERPGLDAYRDGQFDIAIEIMEDRVARVPLDWKARSDLGLAHLQAGQLERALAHAAAAFALRPFDEDVRWNLTITSRRVGWIDPVLRDLAWGGGAYVLARQLPVAIWQALSWMLCGTGSLALAAAVARRHRHRPTRSAFAGAGGAFAASAVCIAMVYAWGALGSPGAAVVRTPTAIRSLPTDLDIDQLELDLEAGRVVEVERGFLGWAQVALANGDLGWVRADALVPVYRELPASGP